MNAPADICEEEADAIADRVLRISDPQIHRRSADEMMREQLQVVQRKCSNANKKGRKTFNVTPLRITLTKNT